jgi:hypothetical protein
LRNLAKEISNEDFANFDPPQTFALSADEILGNERQMVWRSGRALQAYPPHCRPLEGASPPPRLRDLNYVFLYEDPKVKDSGFGTGLKTLVASLNTDFDWLREHTRYLQRATEWDSGGRPGPGQG